MKEEFIAGRNPVAEALRSGRALNKVMVQDGARGVTEIIAAARKKGVAVEFVKSDKLDKLAQGVRHQGVVAYAAPVEFKTLEDALKKAEPWRAYPHGRRCRCAWHSAAETPQLPAERRCC